MTSLCRCALLFLTVTTFSVCFAASEKQSKLRGVDPALLQHYSGDKGVFECLNKFAVVDFARVNDDYCDCPDGSDEPGTSACSNGRFYCRNRGHEPKTISSSFVDDLICDCCDGSDEKAGVCSNKCLEMGAAARQALKDEAATMKRGVEKRATLVSAAAAAMAAWRRELTQTQQQVVAQQSTLQKHTAERDALQAEFDAKKAAEPPPSEAAAPEPLPTADTKVDTHVDEEQRVDEAARDSGGVDAAVRNDDAITNIDDGDDGELSAEELGKKIASQWTHDEAAAGSHADDDSDEGAAHDDGGFDLPPPDFDDDFGALSNDDDGMAAGGTGWYGWVWARVHGWRRGLLKLWRSQQFGFKRKPPARTRSQVNGVAEPEELAVAKARVRDAGDELSKLQSRVGELEKLLQHDYGADAVFTTLAEKCFDLQVDKYTYSVCPYRRAEQKEGHAATSLGQWTGWLDNYTTMSFTGGMRCWQGPDRSLMVHLQCGVETQLLKVDEPSRCEYAAVMTTPALCTHDAYATLQQRVEAVEQEIKSIHDEL